MAPECGSYYPPDILDVSFEVGDFSGNYLPGTEDLENSGGFSNPPKINRSIRVTPTYSNDDSVEEEIVYKFFNSSGILQQSGSSIYDITDVNPSDNIAGDIIQCEVIITNRTGSDTFTKNMGYVYGLPPEQIPDNLSSFSDFTGSITVEPNDFVVLNYTNVLKHQGNPDVNENITTIINDQPFIGSSVQFPVTGLEQNCSVVLNKIIISNFDPEVQETGEIEKTFNINIAGVFDPAFGSVCGTPVGACCTGGTFDPLTGITSGFCYTETEFGCTSAGGFYGGNNSECSDFSGSPCFPEIGTGRCCCVNENNSATCIDNFTYSECNTSNEFFVNCGTDHGGITWNHNVDCPTDCPTSPPPCCAPPVGRCCEFADGIGYTCGINLEDFECPRFGGITFNWTQVEGGCPLDCRSISQNYSFFGVNQYCCEPLGRCCVDSTCTDLVFKSECDEINGAVFGDGLFCSDANCGQPGSTGPCCPILGRCCWKEGLVGNCDEDQTKLWCDGKPNSDWTPGIVPCVNCASVHPEDSEDQPCCNTVLGRCCWKTGDDGNCQTDTTFSFCQDVSGTWDSSNPACPTCTSETPASETCCDTVRGRCCWKTGDDGNCQQNTTRAQCNFLSNAAESSNWDPTNPPCPGETDGSGCDVELSENSNCCDTIKAPCCHPDQTDPSFRTCTPNLTFSQCDFLGGELFTDLTSCPACETCSGSECSLCCNQNISLNPTFDITQDSDVAVGQTVTILPNVSGGIPVSLNYEFYIDGILKQSSSSSSYSIPRSNTTTVPSVAGKTLECVVTASDFDGETTTESISKQIYGESPVLPDSLNSVWTVSDFGGNSDGVFDLNEFVLINHILNLNIDPQIPGPGPVSGSFYQYQFLDSLDNPISGYENLVNQNTPNFFEQVTENLLNELTPGCELKVRYRVSNENVNIPGTGFDEKIYSVGVVRGPDGFPCGTPVGACCVGGVFDPIRGITSGSCAIKTRANCVGTYQGDDTVCSQFSGAPCFQEIGIGRCCCVDRNDNSGVCENGLTYGDCIEGSFFNDNFCSNDQQSEFPGVTWAHNQTCPTPCSVSNPYCCGPQIDNRCCVKISDNDIICQTGLEQIDCLNLASSNGVDPADPDSYSFTTNSECFNCDDQNSNPGYPCCVPRGRCCLRRINAQGYEEREILYGRTQLECSDASSSWDSFNWTENNPFNNPPITLDCSDIDTNVSSDECCVPLGRCCYKTGNNGNCEIEKTKEYCDQFEGSDWSQGDISCVNCASVHPEDSEDQPCCNTVLGRCCWKSGDDGNCEQNRTFSFCQDVSGTWDSSNPACPTCTSETPASETCCDTVRGRCCWKTGDDGNCQRDLTFAECNIRSIGAEFSDWDPTNPVCPTCTPQTSESETCCDTIRGVCCHPDQTNPSANTCTPNQTFSQCNSLGGTLYTDLASCPVCENDCPGLGPDKCSTCCNANATISDITISPDPPVVGNIATVNATILNNATAPVYEFTVDGTVKQSGLSNRYNIPRNPNPVTSVAGKELICTISTTDFDGEITSGSISKFIDGESFTLPDDLLTINVIPGNLWNGGNGKLTVDDNVLVTINTSIINVDPPIRTFGDNLQFQFLDGDEEILGEGTGTSGFIEVNSFNDTCQLKFKVIATNQVDNAPSTGTQEKIYFIGNVFDTTPGTPCGDFLGACCRRSDIDDDPTKGITGWKCDQQSQSDCNNLGGFYQGDNTSCPTCTVNSSGPCCPEIGRGTCCCTTVSNTGLCINDLIYDDCNRSNSSFANCAQLYDPSNPNDSQSNSGDPLWTHNRTCPSVGCVSDSNETDGVADRCCSPATGKCCWTPFADAGPQCEIGVAEEDCLNRSSVDDPVWEQAGGNCPDCTDPFANPGPPCCELRGRCCVKDDAVELGYECEGNITSFACSNRPGNWVWTSYSPNNPLNAPCPTNCDVDNNSCCPEKGRCCFKYGSTVEGLRDGYCGIHTSFSCQAISQTFTDVSNYSWVAGASCPTTCPNLNNPCCDDPSVFGHACDGSSCRPDVVQGNETPDENWYASSSVCPDCYDPAFNGPFTIQTEPLDCCIARLPSVNIVNYFVNDVGNASVLNVGDVVTFSINTVGSDVSEMTYEYYFGDPDDGGSLISTITDSTAPFTGNNTDYTIPQFVIIDGSPSFSYGQTLWAKVTARTDLPDAVATDKIEIIQITAIPPTVGDLNNAVTLQYRNASSGSFTTWTGEALSLSPSPLVLRVPSISIFDFGDPVANVQYQFLDGNGETISQLRSPGSTTYTVPQPGGPNNICSVGILVRASNEGVAGGGVDVESDTGFITLTNTAGQPCGAEIGRCCSSSGFVTRGTLSDGRSWGITFGSCFGVLPQEECFNQTLDEDAWDPTNTTNCAKSCPFTPRSNGESTGYSPCCDEVPGKCCSSGTCNDFVIEANCTGTWTSYEIDDLTCEASCPDAGTECGCIPPPVDSGGCCCPFLGCVDDVTPDQCDNSLCEGTFQSSMIPGYNAIYKGNDILCPVNTVECTYLCCNLDDINAYSSAGQNLRTCIGLSIGLNEKRCQDFTCSGLNTGGGISRCFHPALINGDRLSLTAPCQYLYFVQVLGDAVPICDIDGICSCYNPNDSDRPGCRSDNKTTLDASVHRDYVGNLVTMCETVINQFDPFCVETEWDSTCASQANIFCTLEKTPSGKLETDNLLVGFCTSLEGSGLSDELLFYNTYCNPRGLANPNNATYSEEQSLIDLNDEYVEVMRQNYPTCSAAGNPDSSFTAKLPCKSGQEYDNWTNCRYRVFGCNPNNPQSCWTQPF
jgi:hypothetical protein